MLLQKRTLCPYVSCEGACWDCLATVEPLRFSVAWRLRLLRHFFVMEDKTMPDYEHLYHLMVQASEAALAALETGNVWDAKKILIDAEQRAEEMYVVSEN